MGEIYSGHYQQYIQQKEEFVSNLEGSTPTDVFSIILPCASSILMTLTTLILVGQHISSQTRIIIEFVFSILPCILSCTILADKTLQIFQATLIVSAANLLCILSCKKYHGTILPEQINKHKKLPFLTHFRALVNIITIICILAVDFQVFPRRFAKTETYGHSLMDTGVGLYIFSNAIVTKEARNRNVQKKSTENKDNLFKSLKANAPLLILGIGRCIAVEILGYQKHISEYGVHWNFFLTLFFIRILIVSLPAGLSTEYPIITGIWIIGMHEYALSTNGLKEWVFQEGGRKDFLSANREGWLSIPGFSGLYLIGISLGQVIHSHFCYESSKLNSYRFLKIFNIRLSLTSSVILCVKFCCLIMVLIPANIVCDKYFKVSRRLVNSGYCVWIVTLSILACTLCLITDIIIDSLNTYLEINYQTKKKSSSKDDTIHKDSKSLLFHNLEILEAVNSNGFLFFIFGNLLTGVINMTIKTLFIDESTAMTIIVTYMMVNILFILLRYRRNRCSV